jgi:hypothetical protein
MVHLRDVAQDDKPRRHGATPADIRGRPRRVPGGAAGTPTDGSPPAPSWVEELARSNFFLSSLSCNTPEILSPLGRPARRPPTAVA